MTQRYIERLRKRKRKGESGRARERERESKREKEQERESEGGMKQYIYIIKTDCIAKTCVFKFILYLKYIIKTIFQ